MSSLHNVEETLDISSILNIINQQNKLLNNIIENMIIEYHSYHTLEEKCNQAAEKMPEKYFEVLYFKIKECFTD